MDVQALLASMTWSPTGGYPISTPTSFRSISPTHIPNLSALLSKAVASIATAKDQAALADLSQVIRECEASLTMISGQQILATATDDIVRASASVEVFHASYNLKMVAEDENLYGYYLNRGGNIFFLIVVVGILLFNVGMLRHSRYHWYNVTFICGFILQVLGFLGRVLAFIDNANLNVYLMQFVSLSISPAFLMAGIYFLFAQNVIVHGRQYSVLKPMWYSYFFVFCDIVSLIIQGIGGGMASVAAQQHKDNRPGTWIMFGGVLFQVAAMTVFTVFWFEFITRIYFKDRKEVNSNSQYKRKTIKNWFLFLFNAKRIRFYRDTELDRFYNPKYASIRARRLIHYYPAAISLAVLLIYIRCIYRVVELEEGFTGYLISHEVYLMTLDASMITISGLIFIPFHPVFVFGKENVLKLATIKRNVDEESGNDREVDEKCSMGYIDEVASSNRLNRGSLSSNEVK
ncbi:CIC11C00000005656 [Sungouiella intermedia]|uniref:Sphingoid long-chain base transporter RSB1 n=1 Tax=Sungouiella intermedia TaxID=45354 RepID=A0A1L0CW73_9ASCO|nr:CIC11C00000005656 [[Candida] intermedia]